MSATFEVVGEHVERDVRDAITHIFTSYGEDVWVPIRSGRPVGCDPL